MVTKKLLLRCVNTQEHVTDKEVKTKKLNLHNNKNPNPSLSLDLNSPVLQIEGLTTKYDIIPVSSSLSLLLGSALEAMIVQQLHFWTRLESNGIFYKGLRWIYKSVRELIEEVLPCWSTWKVRMAIASLVEKEILIKEHLFKKHHGHNYHPQNRTLYYAIQYDKLQELAQNAVTTEKFRFVSPTKQVCDCSQNRSNNTYKEDKKTAIQAVAAEIENLVSEKAVTKEEQYFAPPLVENSSQLELKQINPTEDQKAPQIDEKINRENSEVRVQSSEVPPAKPKPKIEKIVNQDWRSHLDELEKLDVTLNKTVISLVKLYKSEQVERALAVLRNRKKESNIVNAAGYFVQALKQNWGTTTITSDSATSENTVDTQAIFRLWYDLAKELGCCSSQVVKDGEQWVNMNGSWETWESAMMRGYSLDYLKGLLRRQNN